MVTKTLAKSAFAAACAATLLFVPPAPAVADTPVNADSVKTRIDLAGRQRMLAERMAKFFCSARNNVAVTESVDALTAAMTLFDKTHLGFVHGDEAQGLFAEADHSVIASWEEIDLLWTPMKATYERALAGDIVSPREYDHAMRMTLEVRKRANDMVAQLRSVYADEMGEGGFGNALLIDLYGRQRMLSQKLSKEVCLVASGHKIEKNGPELNATLKLFETSLNAFRDGMPIAGVPKPPTPEIAAQIEVTMAHWTPVRPIAAKVAAGNAATLSELATFQETMDAFLVDMNKAVKMLASTDATNS